MISQFNKFLLSIAILLSVSASAQITSITNATAPALGGGHTYIEGLHDMVNPANGSVSIELPIPSPKGRGLDVNERWEYNSSAVFHLDG